MRHARRRGGNRAVSAIKKRGFTHFLPQKCTRLSRILPFPVYNPIALFYSPKTYQFFLWLILIIWPLKLGSLLSIWVTYRNMLIQILIWHPKQCESRQTRPSRTNNDVLNSVNFWPHSKKHTEGCENPLRNNASFFLHIRTPHIPEHTHDSRLSSTPATTDKLHARFTSSGYHDHHMHDIHETTRWVGLN